MYLDCKNALSARWVAEISKAGYRLALCRRFCDTGLRETMQENAAGLPLKEDIAPPGGVFICSYQFNI
ncbi:hypothetical protein C7T94_02990 [Pedobacter yulinensis]|uniref:Uncharacterized protein n=1 Tax=Pedobacter yulinensis TaxID=2126353 RepID=A0A2T3HRK9_9SPHI|nr:hypothetical protein C7T94_02990 [Pedobacter yulinensis]